MIGARQHLAGASHLAGAALVEQGCNLPHHGIDAVSEPVTLRVAMLAMIGVLIRAHEGFVPQGVIPVTERNDDAATKPPISASSGQDDNFFDPRGTFRRAPDSLRQEM